MTDILSVEDAAKELGEILISSPYTKRRKMAAQILGRYDHGGPIIYEALFQGLNDPSQHVRVQAFRSLAKMKPNQCDMPDLAKRIRDRIELEKVGSSAWFAGIRALALLSYCADR